MDGRERKGVMDKNVEKTVALAGVIRNFFRLIFGGKSNSYLWPTSQINIPSTSQAHSLSMTSASTATCVAKPLRQISPAMTMAGTRTCTSSRRAPRRRRCARKRWKAARWKRSAGTARRTIFCCLVQTLTPDRGEGLFFLGFGDGTYGTHGTY